jgi:hypothetical protein
MNSADSITHLRLNEKTRRNYDGALGIIQKFFQSKNFSNSLDQMGFLYFQ